MDGLTNIKMVVIKYKNRYGDEFTFSELDNGNVKWEGNFEYCRTGFPNDYSLAWEIFQEEYGGLSFEDFKREVHTYDEVKEKHLFPDLLPLIKSNLDTINMVDPSGGPYLSEGMDLSCIGKQFSGKIIQEFIMTGDGWEIITDEKV